ADEGRVVGQRCRRDLAFLQGSADELVDAGGQLRLTQRGRLLRRLGGASSCSTGAEQTGGEQSESLAGAEHHEGLLTRKPHAGLEAVSSISIPTTGAGRNLSLL